MTTTRHKIAVTRSGRSNGMDCEPIYVITFAYQPGEPAQFIAVEPEFGIVDDADTQKELTDWAKEWLDDNFDRAMDHAEADRTAQADVALADRIEGETYNR
jgi:hypothetical protein